jgi:hypothetical protein
MYRLLQGCLFHNQKSVFLVNQKKDIVYCLSTWIFLLSNNLILCKPAQAGTIVATLESKNTPVCYVKLANGRVQNLTKICGFIKPQSCSTSLGSASRDRVMNAFCQQNEKCLLTNTCNIQPIAPYGPRPGEAAG